MGRARRRLREMARNLVGERPQIRRQLTASRDLAKAVQTSAALQVPALRSCRTRDLTVAITAYCNFRCTGCRYGRDFMPGAELPFAIFETMCADAAEAGVERVRLYGGEPLLHRDLPAMVRTSLAQGLETYVTTNGLLLSRKLPELWEAGLRALTLGFYGIGAEFDEYVGREGAFDQVVAGLRDARQRYGQDLKLRLNWLLKNTGDELRSLEAALAFAEELEVAIQVDLVHYSLPYFTEGEDRELAFSERDRPRLEQVRDRLLDVYEATPHRLDHSVHGLRSIPDWLLLGPDMQVPCDKNRMLWIGADGTVQLCYVTFPLGNLHETRLRDVIGTSAHQEAARGAVALDCPNCHCGYDSRTRQHLPSRRRYG